MTPLINPDAPVRSRIMAELSGVMGDMWTAIAAGLGAYTALLAAAVHLRVEPAAYILAAFAAVGVALATMWAFSRWNDRQNVMFTNERSPRWYTDGVPWPDDVANYVWSRWRRLDRLDAPLTRELRRIMWAAVHDGVRAQQTVPLVELRSETDRMVDVLLGTQAGSTSSTPGERYAAFSAVCADLDDQVDTWIGSQFELSPAAVAFIHQTLGDGDTIYGADTIEQVGDMVAAVYTGVTRADVAAFLACSPRYDGRISATLRATTWPSATQLYVRRTADLAQHTLAA